MWVWMMYDWMVRMVETRWRIEGRILRVRTLLHGGTLGCGLIVLAYGLKFDLDDGNDDIDAGNDAASGAPVEEGGGKSQDWLWAFLLSNILDFFVRLPQDMLLSWALLVMALQVTRGSTHYALPLKLAAFQCRC